jgi:hypothetical protein
LNKNIENKINGNKNFSVNNKNKINTKEIREKYLFEKNNILSFKKIEFSKFAKFFFLIRISLVHFNI